MLFSSITFLYYFLPLSAALYFISPLKLKNAVLLFVSLIFYGWGEPRYVVIMGISIGQGYLFGLLTERYRHRRAGKVSCAVSVVISLSFLMYFKYANFFIENLNAAAGTQLALLRVTLPLGISFYTFQLISYVVDVYRGETAQRNLICLAVYISMFPQLIAGPIVRYADIAGALRIRAGGRQHTQERLSAGGQQLMRERLSASEQLMRERLSAGGQPMRERLSAGGQPMRERLSASSKRPMQERLSAGSQQHMQEQLGVGSQQYIRQCTWDHAAAGVRKFVIGLAKKVLLANQLGELCSVFRDSQEKSVLFFWIYAAAFSLQVYFDFSGYSDMAIGLGRILGFHFPENFDYPFVSASITEFWRRWHISLGSWFRDYVYIPLGGSRAGQGRQLLNILAVWTLTGLWHGASWNFMLWGLYFAVLLMVEKLWLLRRLQKAGLLAHIYTMFFVLVSFVIFNAGGLGQVWSDLGGLFGAGGIPLASAETIYCLRSYASVLVCGIIGSAPVVRNFMGKILKNPSGSSILAAAEPVFVAVMMVAVTAYLVDGSFNPFLYFRF